MSANIFGDRFLAVNTRKPAWWDIKGAFMVPDKMTPSEATVASGNDYNVITLPRVVNLPNGDTLRSDDSVDIVREPLGAETAYQLLGTASKDFRFLQNIKLAEMFDEIAKRYPLETVGSLGNGETFFMCLHAGTKVIAGDTVEWYITLGDTKLPGESLKLIHSPVRTVCQNTYIMGQSQAKALTNILHRDGIEQDLQLALYLIPEIEQEIAIKTAKLEVMTTNKLVKAQIEKILARVYPEPKPSRRAELLMTRSSDVELSSEQRERLEAAATRHDSKVLSFAAYREGAKYAYEKFNDEYPTAAGSSWAMYNAITETEDFRRGSGRVGESALFGWRALVKSRAFESCYAVAVDAAKKSGVKVDAGVN